MLSKGISKYCYIKFCYNFFLCFQAAEIEPLNTSTHLKIVQLLLTENKKDVNFFVRSFLEHLSSSFFSKVFFFVKLAAQYIGRWYQKFDAAKLAAAGLTKKKKKKSLQRLKVFTYISLLASSFLVADMMEVCQGLINYVRSQAKKKKRRKKENVFSSYLFPRDYVLIQSVLRVISFMAISWCVRRSSLTLSNTFAVRYK